MEYSACTTANLVNRSEVRVNCEKFARQIKGLLCCTGKVSAGRA